jgi:hypothetical protein
LGMAESKMAPVMRAETKRKIFINWRLQLGFIEPTPFSSAS